MSAEDQPFSELQLGIRELFRIVVPGAYAVVLFTVLPDAELPTSVTSSTVLLVTAAFFFGLVGYALRPHECWWPYSGIFRKHVDELNAVISRFAGEGEHTALYKYFLTVGPRDVSDRVHYFSSFYYMLISLSLYSAFAALAEFFIPAFRIVYALQLRIAWITALLICLGAVATQLYLMFETPGGNTRNRMTGKVRLVPVGMIAGAAAFISMNLAAFTGKSFFSPTRAAWIIVLGLLAFVFANLGNKQWRSIINEQIVHVLSSGSQIATLGKK